MISGWEFFQTNIQMPVLDTIDIMGYQYRVSSGSLNVNSALLEQPHPMTLQTRFCIGRRPLAYWTSLRAKHSQLPGRIQSKQLISWKKKGVQCIKTLYYFCKM